MLSRRATNHVLRAYALVIVLAACGPPHDRDDPADSIASSAPRASGSPEVFVTPSGFGAVRVGMTVAEAATALGQAGGAPAGVLACGYAPVGGLPAGVRLFVLSDTVVRIDVDSGGARTAALVGVGDPESRVVDAYAGVRVGPHKYTGPAGHVVTVPSPGDSAARLVFETDGRRVIRYRAGRQPAVDLVEGCG